MKNKPPYKVPSLESIARSKTTRLTVASTFSGGGGSCTGYKMAGFDVVWANEFVPSAQESYRANHPGTILDCRDIKLVRAEEILKATGLKKGELDLFDGSPPCQAFSTAGKREKGWAANGGKGKTYEGGETQHNELLFFEYVRLLRGLQPKVFIAENVKGLTMGAAKKMMGDAQLDAFEPQDETILHALMDAGYKVRWQVLDAKHHGVPQTRNRVIFIGIRNDLAKKFKLDPVFPKRLPYVYTVRDAIPWISSAIHETGGQFSGGDETNKPAHAVLSSGVGHHKVTVPKELQLPPSRLKKGAYGEVVNPDGPCPTVTCASPGNDLQVPMGKVQVIMGNKKFKPEFGDPDSGPCPTIMAGGPHGGSGIVQTVTGDETVKRKFTIAELKRICSFPDDYALAGSYAKQWERLGNSVPPVMMSHIAATLRDEVFAKIQKIKRYARPYIAPVAILEPVKPVKETKMKMKTKTKPDTKPGKSVKPATKAPAKPAGKSKPVKPVKPAIVQDELPAVAKGKLKPKAGGKSKPVKVVPIDPVPEPEPGTPHKPAITGKFQYADYWKKRFN